MVLQETEAGISDVKRYSVPVEQTLSAAASPATEVSQGSNTRIQGTYLCMQKNHKYDFSHWCSARRTAWWEYGYTQLSKDIEMKLKVRDINLRVNIACFLGCSPNSLIVLSFYSLQSCIYKFNSTFLMGLMFYTLESFLHCLWFYHLVLLCEALC